MSLRILFELWIMNYIKHLNILLSVICETCAFTLMTTSWLHTQILLWRLTRSTSVTRHLMYLHVFCIQRYEMGHIGLYNHMKLFQVNNVLAKCLVIIGIIDVHHTMTSQVAEMAKLSANHDHGCIKFSSLLIQYTSLDHFDHFNFD